MSPERDAVALTAALATPTPATASRTRRRAMRGSSAARRKPSTLVIGAGRHLKLRDAPDLSYGHPAPRERCRTLARSPSRSRKPVPMSHPSLPLARRSDTGAWSRASRAGRAPQAFPRAHARARDGKVWGAPTPADELFGSGPGRGTLVCRTRGVRRTVSGRRGGGARRRRCREPRGGRRRARR